jgi:hypothetical protein
VLEALGAAGVAPEVVAKVLAPFPVAGPASYSDDWAAPRLVPAFHLHAGTDVFAPRHTPVVASDDGTVSRLGHSAIGGISLRLTTAGGTYYYYAHLDAYAPGLVEGAAVTQGQVLGFVGTTGNAEGTSPHLHYEIHPQGGEAVPPVPYLDRWLAEALATARAMAAAPPGAPTLLGAHSATRAPLVAQRAATRTLVAPEAPAGGWEPVVVALAAAPLWWWGARRRRRERRRLLA